MEQQKYAAVMFADVSGSTKLYDMAGDAIAHKAIDECVSLFKKLTIEHDGVVIKTIGDEVMATFPTSDAAAKAAVAMQNQLETLPEPMAGARLGARIGFHFGPVVERDNDVFGDTVNLSARLTELASKGQIITSDETVASLAAILRTDCRRLYSIQVKGKANDVGICEMLWKESDDATTVAASRPTRTRTNSTLQLRYAGTEIVLPRDKASLTLGRDPAADMVVADRMASRIHCEISMRMDKFILADRSANGTYVSPDGQAELILRREEFILIGHGVIVLGQTRSSATELVEYTVR